MATSMGSMTVDTMPRSATSNPPPKQPTRTRPPAPSTIGKGVGIKHLAIAAFQDRYHSLRRCPYTIQALELRNPEDDVTLMELRETELADRFIQAASPNKRKREVPTMTRIWYWQQGTDGEKPGEKLGYKEGLCATGDDLRKRSAYPVVRVSRKDNELSEFNMYDFARHLTGGQFDDTVGPLVVDCIYTDDYYYYLPAYLAQRQSMKAAPPPCTQEAIDSD